MAPAIEAAIAARLKALAVWGHRETVRGTLDVLPEKYLRAASPVPVEAMEGVDDGAGWDDHLRGFSGNALSVTDGERRRPGTEGREPNESRRGTGRSLEDNVAGCAGECVASMRTTEANSQARGAVQLGLTPAGRLRTTDRGKALREPTRNLSDAEKRRAFASLIFPPPSADKVDALVYGTTTGHHWRERVASISRLAAPEVLARAVADGMAQGKTQQQIARDILPAVNNVRASARRIARTEGVRTAHGAQMAAWKEMGDLIVGFQIHSTFTPHSRSWHQKRSGTIYYYEPKPGQKGMAQCPHPPDEAADPRERPAGTPAVASNCLCFLSPVMRAPEHVTTDPARMAAFTNNAGAVIPDPATYSQWFDRADERRRSIAVGTRRYAAVQQRLGGASPRWEDFVDPESGDLLTIARLKAEDATARAERTAKVRAEMAERERLIKTVATYGFEPPRPTPRPAYRPPDPAKVKVTMPAVDARLIGRALGLGKKADQTTVVNLVGAQEGSRIKALAADDGTGKVYIEVASNDYRASRVVGVGQDGKSYVFNSELEVKDTGKGLGSKILGDQVSGLIRLGGIERIETEAAGKPGGDMNGYYTWPRLGYNGTIDNRLRAGMPENLKDAADVLDLFSRPGGPEWWKANGRNFLATFDLSPGSKSRKVLAQYLQRKGMPVPEELIPDIGPDAPRRLGEAKARKWEKGKVKAKLPKPGKVEQPDLSDEEENILDELWADIAARGHI